MWIGRGDFEADDWRDAVQTMYLPQLADHQRARHFARALLTQFDAALSNADFNGDTYPDRHADGDHGLGWHGRRVRRPARRAAGDR